MAKDLILGTAGHIDHGKSALIRTLTGVDPDRLPEEKRRGITIDLGFAELSVGGFRLGIVDVPGHERFVRNMLAGATGMDLALLVVAADDSVKPQTREHLEILRYLDLPAGVIALTKCDLVDDDWATLVEDEVRELVAGTFLDKAPIVRTSVTDGRGLVELRRQLERGAGQAARARSPDDQAPFRMAIDRVFTVAGYGTVVTGSVSSGGIRVGDAAAIEPSALSGRVRGLRNHDRSVEAVHRGQRAAINLAGVHHRELRRGDELCSPGHLVGSRLLTVRITVLASAPRGLKHRARVRLHLGTAEIPATVRLLEPGLNVLAPGAAGYAQLLLAEPAVAVWNQPLVLRTESPPATIGGGRVLDPHARRLRRSDDASRRMLDRLQSREAIERASAALYFSGLHAWNASDLPRSAGVSADQATPDGLLQRGELVEIDSGRGRSIRLHRSWLDHVATRVATVLDRLHDTQPLRSAFPLTALEPRFRDLDDGAILAAAVQQLIAEGRVHRHADRLALAGRGPQLSRNERKLQTELVERLRQAGLQPPTVEACQAESPRQRDLIPQLLALAAADGDLVEFAEGLYLHVDVLDDARQRLTAELAGGRGLTISQIREMLGTTRKYAVPLCEYFDRMGVTRRDGDLRRLVPSSSVASDSNDPREST